MVESEPIIIFLLLEIGNVVCQIKENERRVKHLARDNFVLAHTHCPWLKKIKVFQKAVGYVIYQINGKEE